MSAPPEEHIRRSMARSCMLCDDGRFDEWAGLFTEDARFVVGDRTFEGRAGIRTGIEEGRAEPLGGKHVTTNVLIRVDSWNGTARVWTDFVALDPDGAVTRLGRYHDEMLRSGDKTWRFSLREVVLRGDAPVATDPPPAHDDD